MTTICHFRKYSLYEIYNADIVITSFNFLVNNKHLNSNKNYNLSNIFWYRIIVDEGHEIIHNSYELNYYHLKLDKKKKTNK